jgi:hypothetical protein
MYSTSSRWSTLNQPRQSVKRFARQSLNEIQQLQPLLYEIGELFSSQPDIYPKDCDRATKSLQSLNSVIRRFYAPLCDWAYLPDNTLVKKYPTLLCLADVSDRTENLLPLLYEFRNICLEPSRQTSKLQRQIAKNLGDLLDDLHRFGIESQSLLRQKQ